MIKIKRNLSVDKTAVIIFQKIDELKPYKDRFSHHWITIQDWTKKNDKKVSHQHIISQSVYLVYVPTQHLSTDATGYKLCTELDDIRKCGGRITQDIIHEKNDVISTHNLTENPVILYTLLEGILLSNYSFDKYKTDSNKKTLIKEVQVLNNQVQNHKIEQINATISAVHMARNLVNEPPNVLTAIELSAQIKAIAKESRIRCQIYDKSKIESLKMGGLLAVNRGSLQPPTFTILEHQPDNPINKQPIVIIGKGVVYDTGGLSLKPTANSMDKMKSDMAGAAVVTSIMSVIGTLDLPIHIIALIPATDNRPGYDAYTPGDVITMHSGKTVEVLNTDAEGRMILADALHFAKRYNPMWIADFATLTGAASAAIGPHAVVAMGNVAQEHMNDIITCGYTTNEKVAQMPFWDEYADYLKSPVADMKNIGGPYAGAITAGKFLEKFTEYPFLHIDIAGVSFSDKSSDYIPAGGTGYGIRMMSNYFINMSKK